MKIRSRLAAAWREFKSGGVDGTLALFREIYGRRPSKSGQSVTVDTALQVATFFACIRVIAEGIAQSPCDLFRDRAEGGGKDLATDHPLYPVLAIAPNALQTPFEFFETLIFHAAVCFNFYAFISTVRGQIDELVPIEPHRVTPRLNPDLSMTYAVRGLDGQTRDFPQSVIWHVRGPSWNSWLGMDFLKIAREALGLTMAIEADQAHLYRNGLRTTGTYSVEGDLNETQYQDLRKHIKDIQNEEGGILLLDRAANYISQTMTGVDAQTLESRKLQIEEICRSTRVMPIMVGHAGSTSPTFASAEQFFIAHVVHTLLPWCRRIETSINKNLIGIDQVLKGLKAKFNLNALMRGSFADRQKAFAQMLGLGGSPAYAEVNEIRELDDMNPVPWGSGKPAPSTAPPKPPIDPTNPDSPPKD